VRNCGGSRLIPLSLCRHTLPLFICSFSLRALVLCIMALDYVTLPTFQPFCARRMCVSEGSERIKKKRMK
jgi:hypothetical protein